MINGEIFRVVTRKSGLGGKSLHSRISGVFKAHHNHHHNIEINEVSRKVPFTGLKSSSDGCSLVFQV